jgi:hypothetical protein
MSRSGDDELTIALDGEVTARDLAESASTFADLLERLAAQAAPDAAVEWIITELRAGSSLTTARCKAYDPDAQPKIGRIIEAGHLFAKGMESGDFDLRPDDPLADVAARIKRLVRGQVVRVRLESATADYVLAGRLRSVEQAPSIKAVTFGAVRGRVQAMSKHGSLKFTLYDVNDERGVSCYLAERDEDQMLGLWGKLVEVEGYIRRDPDTGRPLTIRNIAAIYAVPQQRDIRDAFGAAPGFLGDESSDQIIRRSRDA